MSDINKYKISDLIKQLEEFKNEFGDILVVANHGQENLFPRTFSLEVFEIEDSTLQDAVVIMVSHDNPEVTK